MLNQNEINELQEIYNDLKNSDFKLIEAVGKNTAVAHSLKMHIKFIRLGEILFDKVRWDTTPWLDNDG